MPPIPIRRAGCNLTGAQLASSPFVASVGCAFGVFVERALGVTAGFGENVSLSFGVFGTMKASI